MGDNHRGICFPKDENTMPVYGAVGDWKPYYMEISNFPTSYYNPCRKDKWNVVCMLNLFNRVVHFDDASDFGGYIVSIEMYNYYKSIPSGLIASRMTYPQKRADGNTEQIQNCRVLSH